MRIAVFGASGQLGGRVVDAALGRGHQVTAVVRDTARFQRRDDALTVEAADVTDPESVARVVSGHDGVISAVGRDAARPAVLSDAARALLAGLAEAGVSRLVIAGGAGSLLVGPGQRLVDTPDFHDEWKPEALAQADALALLQSTEAPVQWTYVSPGAALAPGEHRGSYRIGGDDLLLDGDGLSHISMEDFADALLDVLEQSDHGRERITAAY